MLSNRWKDHLNKTSMLFSRTVEREELEIWRDFLQEIPEPALGYAFENWQRNGRFFPKPKDILDLIAVYKIECIPAGNPSCDPACKQKHGTGYDENDMKWLWKKVQRLVAEKKPVEYEALLAELDSKRVGGTPEWRR